MKKFIILFFAFILLFIHSKAQLSKMEIGGFLGVSYYNGDINTSKQFYSPGLGLGFMYKYNLDKHLSTRVNINYGNISASDADFNNAINQDRGASFSTSLIDFSLILEFNFFPYQNSGFQKYNKERFAPYTFIGVGGNYLMSSGGFSNPLNFPFGLGIKYNIFERLTLGVEWSFRKTLNDEIDGVVNVSDSNNSPTIHNTDWFSFCGIFLTYKLGKDKIECPTYN